MQAGSPLRRAQAFPIVILCVTLLAVAFLLLRDGGLGHVDKLDRELDEIRAENGKVEARCREMRRRVDAYRSDPGYIEAIAREELGVVRPDEMVLVLPE